MATGIAGLSDLRAIWNSLRLYRTIMSLLESSHHSGPRDAIEELLIKDLHSLDHLMEELDHAVGQLTSEYSVMEGYSNTADGIREQIQYNGNKVAELRALYRSVAQTAWACTARSKCVNLCGHDKHTTISCETPGLARLESTRLCAAEQS